MFYILRLFLFYLVLICVPPVLAIAESGDEITLTGHTLSVEQIVVHAKHQSVVHADPEALERVKHAHALLLKAAKEDKPVYGLNRGVGLNKDKTLFEGDLLSDEAKQASIAFNRNNLRATSAAAGPPLPEKVVFAIMLVKLNSFLQGTTGVQPYAVELLLEFINRRIQPVIPSRGSIGEADITILAHIGLAMMGEGEVFYQGKRMPASEAMANAGLEPLIPFGKDSLSIMSSNAYASALAALLIDDIEHLVDQSDLIFSLSLEGLNGNVAPFLTQVQKARPYEGQRETARNVRYALQGSSLWDLSPTRELQDPLSFRSASQVHGTVRDLLKAVKQKLTLHLNASDDNPLVVVDPEIDEMSSQERFYYLDDYKGAVIPTANFETINWTVDIEALSIALSHLSHASTQRMLRLSSEKFTHLSRFLAPPGSEAIVFGAIQKTFVAMDGEVKALSMPVSRDLVPVAGEIEDLSTNLPLVLQRLCKMIDTLHYIMGMELMHAAQAADLRQLKTPDFQLGKWTQELYTQYRKEVPFIDSDRPLSQDIERSYLFVSKVWRQKLISLDCVFYELSE